MMPMAPMPGGVDRATMVSVEWIMECKGTFLLAKGEKVMVILCISG